ncbi:ribokinase [Paenibacillus curdlanolyticus YK9]|uniref:Ribokinase n=1 Tax=Paenibacillus curdlanolyticus YK9 TaxID=717606 RepID=E0IDN1_9BACL|nr:ribokinase [Paenibacillus curdlanolyticus]EFM09235.1 ribokinase [Paenibacillus curdlanolyticus YK9]
MTERTIIVAGSLNMDIVSRVQQFPRPGETIQGDEASYIPGGKGANQAVAAARAGAVTSMVGAVGKDGFGQELIVSLEQHGVNADGVAVLAGTSGLALITVNGGGENQIILCPGANGQVGTETLAAFLKKADGAGAVLLQNEIPWAANEAIMRSACEREIAVVYNPAPARDIPESAFSLIHTIVLNETETLAITSIDPFAEHGLHDAAAHLIDLGVQAVIITLGAEGSYYEDREGFVCRMPARKVTPVDTTAAGDTFIGAYAAIRFGGAPGMSDDATPETALRFATAASAITVTRHGAQSSIPSAQEIVALLQSGSLL